MNVFALTLATVQHRLNDRQRVASFFQCPPSDTDSIGGMQFSPDRLCRDSPREQVTVKSQRLLNFRWCLGQELDPEISNPLLDQRADSFRSTLWYRIEQSIPTTNISLQRVFAANAISQLDDVSIAGTAAVGFVSSR